MKITYENEVLGSHHGQLDCEAGIYVDGNIVGLAQYVLYNRDLTVSHIFVLPDQRRKGYGSRLMKYIKQKNPKYRYKPSNLTDDGAKFIHKKLPLDEAIKHLGPKSLEEIKKLNKEYLKRIPLNVFNSFDKIQKFLEGNSIKYFFQPLEYFIYNQKLKGIAINIENFPQISLYDKSDVKDYIRIIVEDRWDTFESEEDLFKYLKKELHLNESILNEETIVGSVWRSCSQEWLHQFINQHGIIDHGKSFISFSFDSESGGQDKFGDGQVIIEFDEQKVLNQGRKQDLGEVYYEEEWMEEHPDVCSYITGYRNKEHMYKCSSDCNEVEGEWQSYIEAFEHEQEIVLKKLMDEEGLIKSITFYVPANLSLINKLKRRDIPFTLTAGLNDSQQKIQFESYSNWMNESIKHLAPRSQEELEKANPALYGFFKEAKKVYPQIKSVADDTMHIEIPMKEDKQTFFIRYNYFLKNFSIFRYQPNEQKYGRHSLSFQCNIQNFEEFEKFMAKRKVNESIKHLSGRSEEEANKVFKPEELEIFKPIEKYLKTLNIKVNYEFQDTRCFLTFYENNHVFYVNNTKVFIFLKNPNEYYEFKVDFSFKSFIEFKEKIQKWIA